MNWKGKDSFIGEDNAFIIKLSLSLCYFVNLLFYWVDYKFEFFYQIYFY